MKNKVKFIFVALILCGKVAFCQSKQELKGEIDKIIKYDTEISYDKIPGFIISIIDSDSIYYFPYGSIDLLINRQLSNQSVFEIGSISKVFTSTLLYILAAKGIIDLDDRVNDHLPFAWQNPRMGDLTITDLINHKSGLPKRPTTFGRKNKEIDNPYLYYSKQDLLEFFRDYIPEKERIFEYSHTNYALLEIIIESKTGVEFEDILNKYLLIPLGLQSTFIQFKESRDSIVNIGYNRLMKETRPWSFPSFGASEGIKSTSKDLVAFINGFLQNQNDTIQLLLQESTSLQENKSFNERLSIINGWQVVKVGNYPLFVHTGMTSGHQCFMGFIKETKTAVVIMCNSVYGVEDLGIQILRLINNNWQKSQQ